MDSAQPTVWQSLHPPTIVRYWPAAESLAACTIGVPDIDVIVGWDELGAGLSTVVARELATHAASEPRRTRGAVLMLHSCQ